MSAKFDNDPVTVKNLSAKLPAKNRGQQLELARRILWPIQAQTFRMPRLTTWSARRASAISFISDMFVLKSSMKEIIESGVLGDF